VLKGICQSDEIGPLTFVGQAKADGDLDRPDIVGSDEVGVRMVLEAKFDAELTPAQVGTAYLDRLETGRAGALLFLVPSDRLPSVWPRILSGPGQLPGVQVIDVSNVDEPLLRHDTGDGRVLAAISWRTLLETLRHTLEAGADTTALGDLSQIEGLVDWRSRTGWTPLIPGDLPERTGRQLTALRDCARNAAAQASSQTARNGSSDSGRGCPEFR
jgi:hypothetical protein